VAQEARSNGEGESGTAQSTAVLWWCCATRLVGQRWLEGGVRDWRNSGGASEICGAAAWCARVRAGPDAACGGEEQAGVRKAAVVRGT
jgi:hypothetical protein